MSADASSNPNIIPADESGITLWIKMVNNAVLQSTYSLGAGTLGTTNVVATVTESKTESNVYVVPADKIVQLRSAEEFGPTVDAAAHNANLKSTDAFQLIIKYRRDNANYKDPCYFVEHVIVPVIKKNDAVATLKPVEEIDLRAFFLELATVHEEYYAKHKKAEFGASEVLAAAPS